MKLEKACDLRKADHKPFYSYEKHPLKNGYD